MLLDDATKTAGIGIGGHAFKHQGCRAVSERTVNDVAVASHPTHVGCTPVNIAIFVVEHILVRHRRVSDVAASGVL